MSLVSHRLSVDTAAAIDLVNITPLIQAQVKTTGIQHGQATIFSCHTTTAIIVNEDEARLRTDIATYLRQLAPPQNRYLHNDLHLREVPPDEPINAHSHLMAITLGNSAVVPILQGQLALGTYQSVLLVELDGPRSDRQVLVQLWGQ